MEKIWIIYLICLIALGFLGIIIADPTDPTEFGDLTKTTCIIGGDLGELNCTGNITTIEEIHFENDIVNHRIYDNATCIIIEGDTSTLNVC